MRTRSRNVENILIMMLCCRWETAATNLLDKNKSYFVTTNKKVFRQDVTMSHVQSVYKLQSIALNQSA